MTDAQNQFISYVNFPNYNPPISFSKYDTRLAYNYIDYSSNTGKFSIFKINNHSISE